MTDPLKSDLDKLKEEVERPAISDWLKPVLRRIWAVSRGLYGRTRKLEREVKALKDNPDVKRALHRGDPHDYVGEP